MFRKRSQPQATARAERDWRSFDTIAETYDRVRFPVHRPAAHDLVQALGSPGPEGFLDVGTGTGVLATAAEEAGWKKVAGIDRSLPMLVIAGGRGVRRLAVADAIDLPFRDSTFQAVGAAFVIHTFTRYDTALFDMRRVLRAGGRMAVATWGESDDEFTRAWRAVAERYTTKEMLRDAVNRAAPWQERFSDPTRLEETLRDTGLRSVEVNRRQYRSTTTLEDYLAGREVSATGRFLRAILGEALWERFRAQVEEEFRTRFRDPIGDTNDVLIAVGTKER
ncbi:MAG: class I SAM-dependent methyltransferase [Actinomycetota bacterium]